MVIKMRIIIGICIALLFLVGCSSNLSSSINSSDGDATSNSVISNSIPSSSSQSNESTIEHTIQWDSVYVHVWNPHKKNYIDWERTIEDQETIDELWDIVEKGKTGEVMEDNSVPNGGVPLEIDFTSDTKTFQCAFYKEGCVSIGDTMYEFPEKDYAPLLALAQGL